MSDKFDVTFTCPAGGLRCVVTVVLNSDGTQSVTSEGGVATATVSADGLTKLAATEVVDTSMGDDRPNNYARYHYCPTG